MYFVSRSFNIHPMLGKNTVQYPVLDIRTLTLSPPLACPPELLVLHFHLHQTFPNCYPYLQKQVRKPVKFNSAAEG